MSTLNAMAPSACPVLDHLACKLPGELEPRTYDVYYTITGLAAGAFRPHQFVEIANRDAPWHLAAIGWRELLAGGQLFIQVYNSRGFAMSDLRIRTGNLFGGPNAMMPVNPSFVWPVNSSLVFDLQNQGAGPGSYALFFYGFKIFDRGKAPC